MRSLKIDTWPQNHEKVESIETTLSKFAAYSQDPGILVLLYRYSCTLYQYIPRRAAHTFSRAGSHTFRGGRHIHLVEQDPIHSAARGPSNGTQFWWKYNYRQHARMHEFSKNSVFTVGQKIWLCFSWWIDPCGSVQNVWGCIGEVYYTLVDSPRDYCVVLS